MTHEETRTSRFDGATYLQLGAEEDLSGLVTLEFVNIDMITDSLVGARIKHFRKERGWSRHRLAQTAGIRISEVKLAETQPRETPFGVFLKIGKALKLSLHDLAEECVLEVSPNGGDFMIENH